MFIGALSPNTLSIQCVCHIRSSRSTRSCSRLCFALSLCDGKKTLAVGTASFFLRWCNLTSVWSLERLLFFLLLLQIAYNLCYSTLLVKEDEKVSIVLSCHFVNYLSTPVYFCMSPCNGLLFSLRSSSPTQTCTLFRNLSMFVLSSSTYGSKLALSNAFPACWVRSIALCCLSVILRMA